MTLPPPLVDPDSDLVSFRDMPLEVVRFAKSDLVAFAPAEAVLAALMLWGSSWHSRPAGSLTDDDRSLMRAAGFGRGAEKAWAAVRDDALRGWIKCADGRLYHPVVAEKVRASWQSRLKQRHNSYLGAIRMHNKRNPRDPREGLSFEDWNEHGRPEGAKAAARRQQQTDLPLDDAMLRQTPDDVTRNNGASYDESGHEFDEKSIQGNRRESKGRDINTDSAPKRGKRISPDFQPTRPYPPKVAALVSQWAEGREDRALDEFRDYWTTRTSRATMLDWDKAWHNRIRDQHDRIMRESRNGRAGNNGSTSGHGRTVDAARDFVAEGEPQRPRTR